MKERIEVGRQEERMESKSLVALNVFKRYWVGMITKTRMWSV